MPPYFSGTKALGCQEAPIWNQREGFHCSLSPHLSSTTPSSCCAALAARRGFLFWFLCWRSKFSGMWNQRRCCHVPLLPPCFSTPSQQPLWDREQHISSSMRNGRDLHSWGGAEFSDHSAQRTASTLSHIWCICKHASEHMCCCRWFHTHTHTHLDVAQFSLFILLQPGVVVFWPLFEHREEFTSQFQPCYMKPGSEHDCSHSDT